MVFRNSAEVLLALFLGFLILLPLARAVFMVGWWLWAVIFIPSVLIGFAVVLARRSSSGDTLFLWALMALLVTMLLLGSLINGEVVKGDAWRLGVIFAGFIVGSVVLSPVACRVFVLTVIVGGLLFSLAVIYVTYAGLGLQSLQTRDGYLATGFRQALAFAGIAGVAAWAVLFKREVGLNIIVVGFLVVAAVGLGLNHGRGAMLFGFMASVVLFAIGIWAFFLRTGRRVPKGGLLGAGAIAIGLPALAVLVVSVAMRDPRTEARVRRVLESPVQNEMRFSIWSESLREIAERPWLGGGIGSYLRENGGTPHNIVLQTAEDGGVFAALVLIVLISFTVIKYVGRVVSCPSWWRLGLLGIVLVSVFGAQTSGSLYDWVGLFVALGVLGGSLQYRDNPKCRTT